jgi:hypothetical protein
VTWSVFALGGILALITGAVAWARARRTQLLGDVRAGQVAIAWALFAIALSVLWSALD